jgi:DNA-binding beta-propeller fold protein YncE
MNLLPRQPSVRFNAPFDSMAIASVVLTAALGTGMATAQGIGRHAVGVIVDRGLANANPALARVPYVHVFDPATNQITAAVALPTIPATGVVDVEIAADLSEAYVADNNTNEIWFIDLTTNPPSLSSGVNPLFTPRGALDLALTPDGRYLLATSGNGLATGGTGMGVIDVHNRTVASIRNFHPYSPIAVEVAPDGSVLVAELHVSQPSYAETTVRRFTLDDYGTLVDTGEALGAPNIPGVQDMLVPQYPFLPAVIEKFLSRHVVYCTRPAGQTLGTLRIAGLEPVAAVGLAYPTGIDLTFDPLRSIVYARTNEAGTSGPAGVGNSRIDGYFLNPITGCIQQHVFSISFERRAGTLFGCEQTALDPILRKLFVSGLGVGEVRVYDSLLGVQTATITSPDLIWPIGVAVRRS